MFGSKKELTLDEAIKKSNTLLRKIENSYGPVRSSDDYRVIDGSYAVKSFNAGHFTWSQQTALLEYLTGRKETKKIKDIVIRSDYPSFVHYYLHVLQDACECLGI